MFCLDGRPSFQKFSLSPSYLAEVVLSLSLTTCSTWQEWHSQQCPRRPKVCMDFGSEKKGSELPFPEVKKLSDCVWAPIAGILFFFLWMSTWKSGFSLCQNVIILHQTDSSKGYPARAQSAWAPRAWALRETGLLMADGAPTGGVGEGFFARRPGYFFRKTARQIF